MKMILNRDPLFQALSQLQSVVEKKNTVQILSHVLCIAENNELSLYATDLECGMRITIPADIQEKGKITIAAKSFFEIVRELPSGSIQIQKKQNHWIELISGKSKFQIVGLSSDDFPAVPDFQSREYFPVNAKMLSSMIEKTAFSVSTDATRYLLTGVYLETLDNGLTRMTATDGHRLSFVDQKVFEKTPPMKRGIILPKKGLLELNKLFETKQTPVKVSFDKGYVFAHSEDTFLFVRLLEGEYPDYRQVIPQAVEKEVKLPLELFHSALKRVSLLSNEKTRGVKMSLQTGSLVITSNNSELGDAREEIDVDFSGEPMEIGFNARYLMECLAILSGKEIVLKLKDKQSPGILQSRETPEHQYVIMPMRLS